MEQEGSNRRVGGGSFTGPDPSTCVDKVPMGADGVAPPRLTDRRLIRRPFSGAFRSPPAVILLRRG